VRIIKFRITANNYLCVRETRHNIVNELSDQGLFSHDIIKMTHTNQFVARSACNLLCRDVRFVCDKFERATDCLNVKKYFSKK
jgi:hypothetical protein